MNHALLGKTTELYSWLSRMSHSHRRWRLWTSGRCVYPNACCNTTSSELNFLLISTCTSFVRIRQSVDDNARERFGCYAYQTSSFPAVFKLLVSWCILHPEGWVCVHLTEQLNSWICTIFEAHMCLSLAWSQSLRVGRASVTGSQCCLGSWAFSHDESSNRNSSGLLLSRLRCIRREVFVPGWAPTRRKQSLHGVSYDPSLQMWTRIINNL